MNNRSIPNLEERLKHASEARKSMLAKFKMSLVEGPAAIEKRQQRQTIAAARAARAVQREEVRLREERDRAEQAELAARQQPTPSARRPSKQPETRPNKQSEMRCLRLNKSRPATPATRHARPPRSNGGGATSPNFSYKRRSALMLRSLGKTGLEIAPLVFGGNVLGWTIDEKTLPGTRRLHRSWLQRH